MSEEKEINSDLIYFFNICNLIQTPDDEKSNQLRIELDNQVSMYELTKEIECKDTGRKYRLHIKHYGEFGDTHMVDIHWKYQNPDEHTWNILNVLTDAFGLIAIVATTPLVVVQIVGLIYKLKTKKIAYKNALYNEDIID